MNRDESSTQSRRSTRPLRALRNRLDTADIVVFAFLVAFLSLLGTEPTTIAVVVALVVVVPFVRSVLEGTDVDSALIGLCFATVVTMGGAFLVSTQEQSLQQGGWFAWLLLASGCWLWLDSLYAWRRGDATDEPVDSEADDLSEDEFYLVSTHSWWVLEELREANGPLSRVELQSRTGLTDADFERVLDVHGESGVIDRVGAGYTVDESELGVGATIRYVGWRAGRRLLRPFRFLRPSG